jgi:DNA-binding MarR family transcriptional regulator
VDGLELFVLGRKLMKLAEASLPTGQLGASVRSVLMDIAAHPGSGISEITTRTGFPQSHVSASVARLRELGAVASEPDPADGRRTLVRVTPEAIRRAARAPAAAVDDALAAVLGRRNGSVDPAELAEVIAALEMLSRRLTPKARARLAKERVS